MTKKSLHVTSITDIIEREIKADREASPDKPPSTELRTLYLDLAEYIREIHPTAEIPEEVRDLNKYNPASGSILDEYKGVLHVQLLRRNRDFDILGNGANLVNEILRKHGLEQGNDADSIAKGISRIILRRLGLPKENEYIGILR